MAYRIIHETFWRDPDIEDLTPEERYFYLYLLTNPSANQIGLFEFSKKRAAFETGYTQELVEVLLEAFVNNGKIRMSEETSELLIIKFWHHNRSSSPKVLKHVQKLISKVKDKALIQYIYGIEAIPQETETETKTIKETKTEAPKKKRNTSQASKRQADEMVNYWNYINESEVRYTRKKQTQLNERLKSFSFDEIKTAIKNRSQDKWINTDGIRHKKDWDSFFRNDEKVERYLNIVQEHEVREKNNIIYHPQMDPAMAESLEAMQRKYNVNENTKGR